jgi:hypothetical protein
VVEEGHAADGRHSVGIGSSLVFVSPMLMRWTRSRVFRSRLAQFRID